MKPVTKSHLERLVAQRNEAKVLKLTKVASSLDSLVSQLHSTEIEQPYTQAQLQNDVNDALWDAVTRISDYLGSVPDSRVIQAEVDKHAEELFKTICVLANVSDGVGAREERVPGEMRQTIELEVNDG